MEDKLQNLPESTKANLTGLPRAWEQMYGVHGGVNRALFWGKFQEFYNQKVRLFFLFCQYRKQLNVREFVFA